MIAILSGWSPVAQSLPSGTEADDTCQRPDGSRFRALPRGSRKRHSRFWLASNRASFPIVYLTEKSQRPPFRLPLAPPIADQRCRLRLYR